MIINSLRILRHSIRANALFMNSKYTLFTESFLKLNDFEGRRLIIRGNVETPNYVKKVTFEMESHDLFSLSMSIKQWIHVMDKQQCKENFPLLLKALSMIQNHNAKPDPDLDRTPNYNFGLALMRMLHLMNMPNEALKITSQFPSMFDQLNCSLTLCDLLFNNGMYKELVEFSLNNESVREKRGQKTSHLQNYITLAACYKLNTQDHLTYGYDLWNKSTKEHQLSQTANFLAMLAINQDQPKMALKILPELNKMCITDKHFSTLYVRLIALCDCGYFAKAIEIIESNSSYKFRTLKIAPQVVCRIKQNFSKYPQNEDTEKLTTLLDSLQHPTSGNTIDDVLCWPLCPSNSKYDGSRHASTRTKNHYSLY